MNGYEKRRQRIIERIEKSALELFTNDEGGRVQAWMRSPPGRMFLR